MLYELQEKDEGNLDITKVCHGHTLSMNCPSNSFECYRMTGTEAVMKS